MKNRIEEIIAYYENLSLANLETLGNIYAPQLHFKDPFIEIFDLPGLKRYYTNLWTRGRNPRFKITASVGNEHRCALIWVFRYERFHMNWEIRGCFWVELNSHGLIVKHEDFWDVSSQIYERLPVIGLFFRAIKWGISTLM
ncbi:MAG: nuclear transport factor 2 family protein [Elusimicrobia bacterium]|nr:nuclear transport factor 2 family protein [Elusimicrobiota bacterium]